MVSKKLEHKLSVYTLKHDVKVTKFCFGFEELIVVYKQTKFDINIINSVKRKLSKHKPVF